MARALSLDLRERVVGTVEREDLSCRQAAARFGVGVSTVVKWMQRLRATGSVTPGRAGGRRPKTIRGEHALWLAERCRQGEFTLRGLVAELLERGVKADYRSVHAFVHAQKLTYKKRRWSHRNGGAATLPAGAVNG
jgi:putative transposase